MTLLDYQPAEVTGRSFRAVAGGEIPDGRCSIYEEPKAGRRYVIGADFAHGVGRDYDAACVYDKTCQGEGDGVIRQVAEAKGHWGPKFWIVLYGLIQLYNNAYLLGERQGGGTHTMRWLWDYCGVHNMYCETNTDKAAPVTTRNPMLGWPARANDVVMPAFRLAVAQKRVRLASEETIRQMQALRFAPRSKHDESDRDPDVRLRMKLPGGGSPDLVMAAAYGWYAIGMVHLPSQRTSAVVADAVCRDPIQPKSSTVEWL